MILDEILEHKRQEVESNRRQVPVAELRARIRNIGRARDFRQATTKRDRIRLIAEMKQASPSAGLIREDFAPGDLAVACEQAGAAAISVLTDERFFRGHLAYIRTVKERVALPVLRKDFIIDEYQVYESRAGEADAVLLIVRAMDLPRLKRLRELARQLGMYALVEVHSEHEVEAALNAGAEIIGINNRNLETFRTDLSTTARLRPLVGTDPTIVTESGIATRRDMERLEQIGVDAALVGETIMRSADVAAKARELLGDSR